MTLSPTPAPIGWELVPHVCRHCCGRILHRLDIWRCANCGAVTNTATSKPICACGKTMGETSKPAGFRCGPNPDRAGPNRSEIVILFGDVPAIRGDAPR